MFKSKRKKHTGALCIELRALLIEIIFFVFWLGLAPRLNFDGLLYKAAGAVSVEEILAMMDEQNGLSVTYAGYPGKSPTKSIVSAKDLQTNYVTALQIDASRLKATGVYKQVGHRPSHDRQSGIYGGYSTTYGFTSPAITRSWWSRFSMKPYADYAQYYIITFEDGSRTWALVYAPITRIPRRGTVTLPVGYYSEEGAARFMTDEEKQRYKVDQALYDENCIDLYSGWLEGTERERFYEKFSLIQSICVVLSGGLMFITFILFMLPERKKKT